METKTDFSFTEKTVTVVGGKGKMGSAFAEGLASVGARIQVVDRDTKPLGENTETDMLLFAVNELTTINLLRGLNQEILDSIPIITTSSTNQLLHTWTLADRMGGGPHLHERRKLKHLIPIHTLSGPKMEGAVMIDCTNSNTLERTISSEIARIMKMEQEFVSLEAHDREIALGQAQFHWRIWNSINSNSNLLRWASQLPQSQRRAAMGELRTLFRPDISGELIGAFLARGSENVFLGNSMINFGPEDSAPNQKEKAEIIEIELNHILSEKDPDGSIRNWVRTENTRMDQGIPGGPRSFQEFLRSYIVSK